MINPLGVLPNQTRSYHYQGDHNGAIFRLMRRIASLVKHCFSPLARKLFPKGPEFVVYLVTCEMDERAMRERTTLLLDRVLKTRVRRRVEAISYEDFLETNVAGKRFLTFTEPRAESSEMVYNQTSIGNVLDKCLGERASRGLVIFWDSNGAVELSSELRGAHNLQGESYLNLGSFWTPSYDRRYNTQLDANLQNWLGFNAGE